MLFTLYNISIINLYNLTMNKFMVATTADNSILAFIGLQIIRKNFDSNDLSYDKSPKSEIYEPNKRVVTKSPKKYEPSEQDITKSPKKYAYGKTYACDLDYSDYDSIYDPSDDEYYKPSYKYYHNQKYAYDLDYSDYDSIYDSSDDEYYKPSYKYYHNQKYAYDLSHYDSICGLSSYKDAVPKIKTGKLTKKSHLQKTESEIAISDIKMNIGEYGIEEIKRKMNPLGKYKLKKQTEDFKKMQEARTLELFGTDCDICTNKKHTFVKFECGHSICSNCSKQLFASPKHGGYINLFPKCPICRKDLSLVDMNNSLDTYSSLKRLEIIKIARTIKLEKNDYHCLCSKCNRLFVGTSTCGSDLTHLPTMCTKCFDETENYDEKNKTYCSSCRAPYIRRSGCNIITCPICGANTCHLCGCNLKSISWADDSSDTDYDSSDTEEDRHFPHGSFDLCINAYTKK